MQMIVKQVLTILTICLLIAISLGEVIRGDTLNEQTYDSIHEPIKEAYMDAECWPTYHHDLTNSGYSLSYAPDTNATLWMFQSSGTVYSPSVADGKVYFGTDCIGTPLNPESFIYCIDFEGVELWRYKTYESLDSTPAVDSTRVYVGGEQGGLYCLDATTGQCLWLVKTDGGKVSSPRVIDNKVYCGTLSGTLYCFDAESGEHLWNQTIGIDIKSTPAIVQGKLYVSNYCIDASNGNIVWVSETRVPFLSSPTISNGTMYVGAIDEFVYAVNADDGKTVWDHYTGSMRWELSPSIAYGNVYVGNAFGYLFCIDSETGDEKWVIKKSTRTISSPAIANGKIYVGSIDGNVYCFDAYTGITLWSYQANEPFDCSPAIADGKVFIGSGNQLYCFGEDQNLGSDLECVGSISWQSVKPTSRVTGNFSIANVGEEHSQLDWTIESYPEWGNWTFSQLYGYDLEPLDGACVVGITVVAPSTKNGSFQGTITLVNSHNPSDYGMVDVSMATINDKRSDLSLFQKLLQLCKYPLRNYFS